MEREQIMEMGIEWGREATERARDHANEAVKRLAAGEPHHAVLFVHLAHQENARAERITVVLVNSAHYKYPANLMVELGEAAQNQDGVYGDDRAALDGLAKMVRHAMFEARAQPIGEITDWNKALGEIRHDTEQRMQAAARPWAAHGGRQPAHDHPGPFRAVDRTRVYDPCKSEHVAEFTASAEVVLGQPPAVDFIFPFDGVSRVPPLGLSGCTFEPPTPQSIRADLELILKTRGYK